MSPTRSTVLVSASELQGMLDSGKPVHLLDVRWALGRDDGHERFLAAHLPGAVYVDLDTELASAPSAERGRHPLPDVAALERDARRWGVRAGSEVVVYDDAGGRSAARAWWLLRWAGVDVRLLDGGLDAWAAGGGQLVGGETDVPPGDVSLVGGQLPVVEADGVATLAGRDDAVVLDARARERFRGEIEPVDPRAGHVPGAVSAPTDENLSDAGLFLADEALRRRFEALGVDVESHQPGVAGPDQPVAVYCGSGVTASHEVLALAAVGVTAALYPGSWSQWSHDPERPAATGD